jgi:hemerythrin-like domain-containing protein
MRALGLLIHEHIIILLALEAADREVQFIRETGSIRASEIEKLIDFFNNFIERSHHCKEEKHLFVKMRQQGVFTDSRLLAEILQEHEQGRRRIQRIIEMLPHAKTGDAFAITVVRDNLLAYVRLLRSHINRENNVLYPMIEHIRLRGSTGAGRAFAQVEAHERGEGIHEKYHQLAHDLAGSNL